MERTGSRTKVKVEFRAGSIKGLDANGNTLTEANGNSYSWDFENRLTQAVVPGTNGGTTTFKYDPFGRRIQKSGPLGTTNYLYDGEAEFHRGSGQRRKHPSPLHRTRTRRAASELRSGTTSYYQQDGLNSITSLTNSTGVLANTYAFDSFGNLTASTGTITNPFRYTGRDFDPETSLYFYRARYFDQNIGRFISEDPTRFAGDGPNFYAYTLNNPVIYADPLGTQTQGPPPPPTPGLPGGWGGPEPGGWVPNAPPPQTGPLSGPALNLANCMAHALGRYFVVTGGSECTPDGRHVPGGVKGSKHCTNQAIDIRPAGQDQHSLFCAALNCGAQNIINEGDHYHVQTVHGPGGASGLLPKGCDCPSPK